MEAYRSGHNGHDWKSCSLHGLRGSNPLASANQNLNRIGFPQYPHLILYSHAPAKVPFEVYNGFLLEFNSKTVYNGKTI